MSINDAVSRVRAFGEVVVAALVTITEKHAAVACAAARAPFVVAAGAAGDVSPMTSPFPMRTPFWLTTSRVR